MENMKAMTKNTGTVIQSVFIWDYCNAMQAQQAIPTFKLIPRSWKSFLLLIHQWDDEQHTGQQKEYAADQQQCVLRFDAGDDEKHCADDEQQPAGQLEFGVIGQWLAP